MKKGALEGILVLDMSRLLPGPYTSMILADHGARVIAIEDRRFAGEYMKDGNVNRNKEHMPQTLDYRENAMVGKDICWAPVRRMDEAVESPLFREREMVVEVEKPGKKPFKTLGVPVKLSRTPGSVRSAPPGFGQDTGAILKQLGYRESEIEKFERTGVV